MNRLVILVLLFILGILFLMWWIIPVLTGLPWKPTSRQRILRALELSNLCPGEKLYDLGSGDGRVLIIAARDFKAIAVGIEISPLHRFWSQLVIFFYHLETYVKVRQDNFYRCNLKDADVVYAYMTSAQVSKLKPHLESQLQPGTRVVTISFDIEGWEPDVVDRDKLIFLYQMPPKTGNLGSFLEKWTEQPDFVSDGNSSRKNPI